MFQGHYDTTTENDSTAATTSAAADSAATAATSLYDASWTNWSQILCYTWTVTAATITWTTEETFSPQVTAKIILVGILCLEKHLREEKLSQDIKMSNSTASVTKKENKSSVTNTHTEDHNIWEEMSSTEDSLKLNDTIVEVSDVIHVTVHKRKADGSSNQQFDEARIISTWNKCEQRRQNQK